MWRIYQYTMQLYVNPETCCALYSVCRLQICNLVLWWWVESRWFQAIWLMWERVLGNRCSTLRSYCLSLDKQQLCSGFMKRISICRKCYLPELLSSWGVNVHYLSSSCQTWQVSAGLKSSQAQESYSDDWSKALSSDTHLAINSLRVICCSASYSWLEFFFMCYWKLSDDWLKKYTVTKSRQNSEHTINRCKQVLLKVLLHYFVCDTSNIFIKIRPNKALQIKKNHEWYYSGVSVVFVNILNKSGVSCKNHNEWKYSLLGQKVMILRHSWNPSDLGIVSP